MDWIVTAVVILLMGVGGLLLWFQLKGRLSDEHIRDYLADGALVVDVRTKGEFEQRRVEGAINLPLDQVVEGIRSTVSDDSQVILCHCESGGRSAIAVARLRRAGYANAFNLGSFNRAAALSKPSK